ncbi:DUF58 domain-containing protein [Longimicrobium sp.]|uniref:DUF58 domain-containing protein n=1 Tax=Longimicrobium sp. TaxID=2029185 RepID=UPI002E38130C|nr:DUF58 domain-containing protein [Longimicrobium sp.]HEX6040900.1 DUF58 domain-containing protein [Longimicrobium sp.]
MSLLPSGRWLALLAAAAPLFWLSTPVALGVDLVLLVLLLLDWRATPGPDRLTVARKAPARISLGATAEVEIRLDNRTGRRVRVRVTDDLPPVLERQGPDVVDVWLPALREERVTYGAKTLRRGDGVLGDVHLRIAGPLGLAWTQRRIARADAVRVIPGMLEVARYRLLGMRNRLREAGFRSVRQRGEGGSFESLREYVRGDDPRTLDWKASARRGGLIVRQYEMERRQNIVLAIDAGRLMTQKVGERERLDYALTAALLLADVAGVHDDAVGLLVFSDKVDVFLPPARKSLTRLSEALGQVHAKMVEPNYPAAFTYLGQQVRRRSLLVLFTDVIDPLASAALVSQLSRAAERHLPLAVAIRNPDLEAAAALEPVDDDAVYRRAAAEELLQSRAAALGAMQRAGVLIADTRPGDAVPSVVNKYLDVKRRGML